MTVAAAVVGLLLAGAIVFHAAAARYETVHIAGGFFVTTDRWTGRRSVCRVSTVSPMECAPTGQEFPGK